MVKILGERFASGLSPLHPMEAYLTALYHTGFYYTFIGVAQVLAALLLLIPRTVTLGALLYLPIITNIWILSFALRFEGSFVSSPLMVLANLYLLFWNYDRLKYILSKRSFPEGPIFKKPEKYSNKFPFRFFAGVIAITAGIVLWGHYGFDAMPRNSLKDCKERFQGTRYEAAGYNFCKCIHLKGRPLDECLEEFNANKD